MAEAGDPGQRRRAAARKSPRHINRHKQRALHDTQTETHDPADSAVAVCSNAAPCCGEVGQQSIEPVSGLGDIDKQATGAKKPGLARRELALPGCAAVWVLMMRCVVAAVAVPC